MTGWDVLDKIINGLPPLAVSTLLVAAVAAAIMCIIGFGRHGTDFIKHGFKQTKLDAALDSRFDTLTAKIDGLGTEISGVKSDMKAEIGRIKSDMKAEIGGVKSDMKAEIGGIKSDMKAEIDRIKSDMKAEISGIKSDMKAEIGGVQTELTMIKVNHFGHLKNYLGVLNSILLDQNIINNESKARLDNELRGM